MKYNKSIELLRRYLLGKTNPEEDKKIDHWYESFDSYDSYQFPDQKTMKDIREDILAKTKAGLGMRSMKPVIPFYKRAAFRAAAIILVILATAIFFLSTNSWKESEIASNQPNRPKNDVAPPTNNKAILKLADGSIIQLDSSGVGTLAVQNNIQVVKLADGRIAYEGEAGDNISYNTLSIPKGSKPMKLVLIDGSEVWLNVASSITYPTAFIGTERKVEITGEVYFEIAKNKDMPFVVKKTNDDAQVRVLGTHFNVNAYDDESSLKVTLLEGSVDVSKDGDHKLLKPGQQALIGNQVIKVLNEVDLEEVMAWKNSRFYFDGADIKTVMRQVEKWYNVEVKYDDEIPYSFVAKISRDVNASELFKILQYTELVHFKIDGNKITVMK
jgi:transmembrane sensor